MSFTYRLAVAFAFLLLTAGSVCPQSFTGSILGMVTDSTGSVMPGVTVTAINPETGEKRTVTTTQAGQYTISALPPGAYELTVEVQGFRGFRRENLRVDVLQNLRIDVMLEPGAVTETITVRAESPLLEASNAAVGQVIDNVRIVDLPLNGRNVLALVDLTTGVQPGTAGNFGGQPVNENVYAQGTYSVNSGLQSQSEALLDGVPNNVFLWNAPAFVPSVDAVQEFRVQTSSFSAEFGHTGGGIVNLTTKSGTNTYHGTAYEFFRTESLDANNFFNNRSGSPKPPFTLNQFGGSLGGPVRLPHYNGRDKTFFFANYEGFRQTQGRTFLASVPDSLQRDGDFSQTFNAAGRLIQIYDPQTVRATSGVGSGYSRDAFPGNRIPRSRFDLVGANAVKIWAVPNLPGDGPAKINNFIANPNVPSRQDQLNIKIDQVFNDKHRLFGRFSRDQQVPGQADVFNTVPGARTINNFELNTALLIWAKSFALDHTWMVNSTLLANFRYGFTRQRQFRDPASIGFDPSSMGFSKAFGSQVQIPMLPKFTVQGLQAVGEGGDNVYFRRGDNIHSAQANVTKTLSQQTLKFGFEFRAFLFNDMRAPGGGGNFSFNPAFTQADPLRTSATAGYGFASLLLGAPAGGSVQYFPAVSLNQDYYALFLQDDIRITPNLTLNLGLRWDLETPKTERYNRLSSFDSTVVSPLSKLTGLDVRGGLRFLGVNDFSRGQWAMDSNNFAPRIGFAYRISPRLVARGGYGIFFQQTVGQGGLVGNGNDGFGGTSTMVTTTDGGVTVKGRLSDPFPDGITQPTGSSLGLMTRLGESLQEWSQKLPLPYSQQYNFGLQHEIPGLFLIDASYVGRHAVGIPINLATNQMRPEYLQLQDQLLTQAPNPFFGIVTTGVMATANVTRNRLLRPFPQFDGISIYSPVAQENYQSFQLRVERRLTRGFGFLLGYTMGKSLTTAGGGTGMGGFNTPSIQNVYALSQERALSPNDVSQRFVFSYQWELPFGKGRMLFSGVHGVLDKIVSGWRLNGISTFQTGRPLSIGVQANQVQAFSGARPDIKPGADAYLPASERSLARWFDTSVFVQPAPYRFGGLARTLSNVRSPGIQNFDVSLFKNVALVEKVNLQLRFEAFNAFNHANFGGPGTAMATPQFGVISSTGPSRTLQLAAKVVF